MVLQQPRLLIPRVAGRDLHVLVDRPYAYFRAGDVEAIAGVPPWSTGEMLLGPVDQLVVHEGVEFYPLDAAIARVRDEGMDRVGASAFLDWIEEGLPGLLDPALLDAAARRSGFASSYTVARAAEVLSRDPVIDVGRDGLFDHLERVGWICRPAVDEPFEVRGPARDAGWLTVRVVLIGRGKRARRYPQVHVTPAGLVELSRTFHALHAPAQPASPAPMLPLPEWTRS